MTYRRYVSPNQDVEVLSDNYLDIRRERDEDIKVSIKYENGMAIVDSSEKLDGDVLMEIKEGKLLIVVIDSRIHPHYEEIE